MTAVDALGTSNLIEQEIAPAIFRDVAAIVPKPNFSPKTVCNEHVVVPDGQITSCTSRIFVQPRQFEIG